MNDSTAVIDRDAAAPTDHELPPGIDLAPPPPLVSVSEARRRTPAEEARTLLAANSVGALGSVSEGGHPWASLVTYGALDDGSPVLLLSALAEHGRNLTRDPRASLMVAKPDSGSEPLAHGRVTLVCDAERAEGELRERAREAHVAAVPSAHFYADFGDFTFWVLRVRRVRWVGGYGRMDSATAEAYAGAEPDPTWPAADRAVSHLNEDHADALLAMGRALAGYPDATAAQCASIDRYGLDLELDTPRGRAPARVGFARAAQRPGDLRAATIELAKAARAAVEG